MPTLLAAVLLAGQAVYAPPDVPKDHWAFSAVNEMFKDGLLKGYPADSVPVLKIAKPLKYDQADLEKRLKSWRECGLLEVWLDNRCFGGGRPPSHYEVAVYTHAVCINMITILRDPAHSSKEKRLASSQAENIVAAFAMLMPELKELDVDVDGTISQLDAAVRSRGVAFRG